MTFSQNQSLYLQQLLLAAKQDHLDVQDMIIFTLTFNTSFTIIWMAFSIAITQALYIWSKRATPAKGPEIR